MLHQIAVPLHSAYVTYQNLSATECFDRSDFEGINNFFHCSAHSYFFYDAAPALYLLMVGPCEREWKVLRETDGERFIAPKKVCCFQGHFADCENEKRWNAIFLTIENPLYAI